MTMRDAYRYPHHRCRTEKVSHLVITHGVCVPMTCSDHKAFSVRLYDRRAYANLPLAPPDCSSLRSILHPRNAAFTLLLGQGRLRPAFRPFIIGTQRSRQLSARPALFGLLPGVRQGLNRGYTGQSTLVKPWISPVPLLLTSQEVRKVFATRSGLSVSR